MANDQNNPGVLVLYPLRFIRANYPVIIAPPPPANVPIGGLAHSAFTPELRRDGIREGATPVQIDPPSGGEYQAIALYMKTLDDPRPLLVERKSVAAEDQNNPTFFNVFQSLLVERVNIFFYVIERSSGNDESSRESWALYHHQLPGGNDVPGTGDHPHLKLSLPAELGDPPRIGKEEAAKGVPLTLSYPHGQPYDKILLMLNGKRFTFTLQPGEQNQPYVILLTQELFEQAGNNPAFEIRYTVISQVNNPTHKRRESRVIVADVDLEHSGEDPGPLKAPRVPAFYDGLVTEADARASVEVLIPTYANVAAGDEITGVWGTRRAMPVTLMDTDLPNDPVIAINLRYPLLVAAGDGPIDVTYEVRRGSAPVKTSPETGVVVDLSLVGGPDPKPETPEHDNLLPVKVVSAGGTENAIPPQDYDKNATGVIAWLGKDGKEIYALDDIILLTWGNQTGSAVRRQVQATDINDKVNLVLNIPAKTIGDQGSGNIAVGYTVSRKLSVAPHENTSIAPKVTVSVSSKASLPGGGTLPGPVFPVLNENNAIGPNELLTGSEGLYNPIRIATDYLNGGVGNTLELFFVGYDQLTGGNLVPGAEYTPTPYKLTADDIARTYYEFRIPARYHYAVCSRGGVEAHVIIGNSAGKTTSAKTRVFCDVKEPSWENCHGRP